MIAELLIGSIDRRDSYAILVGERVVAYTYLGDRNPDKVDIRGDLFKGLLQSSGITLITKITNNKFYDDIPGKFFDAEEIDQSTLSRFTGRFSSIINLETIA